MKGKPQKLHSLAPVALKPSKKEKNGFTSGAAGGGDGERKKGVKKRAKKGGGRAPGKKKSFLFKSTTWEQCGEKPEKPTLETSQS